jgi:hypothetical protein
MNSLFEYNYFNVYLIVFKSHCVNYLMVLINRLLLINMF